MELRWRPEVVDDMRALPTEELRLKAAALILDVRDGRRVGEPLDYRVATGDLRDCRKVYFGSGTSGVKPEYRFVYRIIKGELEAFAVEALAVGGRADLAAYVTTADRLGRRPK